MKFVFKDIDDDMLPKSDKDVAKIRWVYVGKTRVKITSEDHPHGFWTIHLERGFMPEKYRGEYTSFTEAHKAVFQYARDRKEELSDVIRPDVHTKGEAMLATGAGQ